MLYFHDIPIKRGEGGGLERGRGRRGWGQGDLLRERQGGAGRQTD